MDLLQILTDIGFEDKEPLVYQALLKLPGAQPASVIADRTNLNRTTVYKTLLKLAKRGLATKTMRHGILCFYAEDAVDHLENIVLKHKKKLESTHQSLISMLPAIKELKKQEMLSPKMRYYEGFEGIKRVYEDTLIQKKPIFAFENVATMAPEVREYLFENYVPRRIEENIFAKVITPENKANKSFRHQDKKQLRETRFAPFEAFPVEIEINIYGEKTAFFSYKQEEMFGAILESESIANSMRAIFNFCWIFAK